VKTIVIGVLMSAGLASATPALAQGVYFGAGPGGVGVGIGGPGYYDGYYDGGYYGPAPAYGYRSRGYDGPYAFEEGYRRCRVRVVETPYGIRRVRRCS
jgi:hypothetical protein